MTNKKADTLHPIYEIVKIRAERRKLPKKYLSENLADYAVRGPEDFANIAIKFIGDEDREIFLVACLSTKNQIQSLHRCHIGSLNASIVSPREVFKTAFLQNAASIIVAHTHPSGVCTPSPEDIAVTQRLKDAGELLGVELLDHLIVCTDNYLSLKEKGYM
ncbi:JAB domain-containing protein [Metasolibacillus meyeri]|uniref:JAB domain-containing protein n=1 Tax=Metasolibacillus meyeri TaxID=1071052 RepID=UPI000D3244DB|nr:JAB domain-containing protein [Metasolibacillus meyeri]